ncbi:sensor histidine kinase [Paenibacillus apiarius]|uniref:Sensor histidine kinase n=1 Tax=Paenibacillus apiarius TaxID=46240 RepID=A0ABT4E1X4_9BACL|nr:sensor histidine kinase [Paenibacillus apiarius]MCY9517510.1 sensor histidine kinase [Paenibacillus apiarius]MCY9522211.1 sensor histidine kinase [Paenibacillus apiarius]MCY9552245.1 sensor histidine kinase [Paenibacillus apiarius]MCY9560124.1 sensor histidine kinase [Paenibacillus apiarius]MCY9683742.1 sensor histidine kinase [Paenibacillus apiarius]
MRNIRNRLRNVSLKQKLIIVFSCFLIIPFVIIGGTLSWLYMDSNRNMILDAAVDNNNQIVKNIDTSLQPLLRLAMYPERDQTIFQIMRKNYDSLPYPLYERGRDFDTVNGIIRNSMMLYTDLLDSAVIYQSANHVVVGRSNNGYMDHNYLEHEFYYEPYIQTILQQKGLVVPVGIHPEKLMSFHDTPVVSIGRAIVDPYTKENLGLILLNIGIDKLAGLWSSIHFTEHTQFYLLDEQKNIVYSKNPDDIGAKAASVLEHRNGGGELGTKEDAANYIITSASEVTNWQAVTIIPKQELFSFVNVIVRTIFISLLVLLGLSILASIYIATSITKPLSALNAKMKLVAQGKLGVNIDIQHGEVGRISITIDHMLQEIRRLIQRIYDEEQEKRHMELLALQSQIRPHFMYNTLNVIKWMAKIQGATGIEEALTAFSSVIKFTAKTESDVVTIQEEVEFIKNYTNILDFRYFNKFEVEYDIDPEVLPYKTLKFLLQPLVENAVFHGFDGIPYKGKLSIRIYRDGEHVVMIVADNGRGMSGPELEELQPGPGSDPMNGIGVKNIRSRIELNYGTECGLWMTSAENAGTTATIIIPAITEGERGIGNESINRG